MEAVGDDPMPSPEADPPRILSLGVMRQWAWQCLIIEMGRDGGSVQGSVVGVSALPEASQWNSLHLLDDFRKKASRAHEFSPQHGS